MAENLKGKHVCLQLFLIHMCRIKWQCIMDMGPLYIVWFVDVALEGVGKNRNESGFVSIVSRARHDNKCDCSQMAAY